MGLANDPMRPRQGCDIPASIDNYAKVESRQEMGYKLNTFLGTVTGSPHINILLSGKKFGPPRTRDTDSFTLSPKHNHLRTALSPYRTEVF
jgi:hypothetical protein